jgi:nickel-dependent lactate racemase
MRIKIPYDGAEVELDFPFGADILEAINPPVISDQIVRNKINASFSEFKHSFSGKRVSVIVNDATRRLPTPKILRFLLKMIPASQMEILIATGTHRAPTDHELNIVLGDTRKIFSGRIHIHDCRDESSLVNVGVTFRGTPVILNRKLIEAESIVAINSVEPHFFAGFTGCWKSFVPGLSGFSTTVQNHSLAKDEYAKSLSLEKNPLHQDLMEAADFVKNKPIFSIQLITSREGEIVDIYSGDLKPSFDKACLKAKDIFTVDIKNKYEIIFAVGEPPLDINLYQLQKGQEHGAEAVADGGILVVVGACPEGTGSEYFIKLSEDYPTPALALSDKAMQDNRFGIHKLVKTARRLKKIKIWYITKVDDKTIRKVYYEPKESIQAALNDALETMGRHARVAVLRDACFIVPFI